MQIRTKCVLTEALQFIGIVERYYNPICKVYQIIQNKLQSSSVTEAIILQIAIKAVNDTASLNGLVFTLLVFRTYLRLTNLNPLSLSVR
jgi:hypothetical protein